VPCHALEQIYSEDFSTTDSSWGELGSRSYGDVVADFRIESQAFRKTLTTVNDAPWFNWSPNVPGVVRKDFFYVLDATLVDTSDLNAASVLLPFRISDDNWSLYKKESGTLLASWPRVRHSLCS
jgi:hypothetical protein